MSNKEQTTAQMASELLERAAFFKGLYGEKDVERLMDELDVLLAKVDEETAAKILQVAYKLARR